MFALVPITGHMRVSIYIQSYTSWILYSHVVISLQAWLLYNVLSHLHMTSYLRMPLAFIGGCEFSVQEHSSLIITYSQIESNGPII